MYVLCIFNFKIRVKHQTMEDLRSGPAATASAARPWRAGAQKMRQNIVPNVLRMVTMTITIAITRAPELDHD